MVSSITGGRRASVALMALSFLAPRASRSAEGEERASGSRVTESSEDKSASVPAGSEVGAAPEPRVHDEAAGAAIRSARSLCTEVCEQNEACIRGRCLATCTPACREGTYCAPDGQCLQRSIPQDRLVEGELLRRAGAESAAADEAVLLDFGGIIFQGVSFGYERGAVHSLALRLQLMNTGLQSYAVEPRTAQERFEFGFGAGLGYRHYEALWGNLRGLYYGGGLAYQGAFVVDENRDHFSRWTHLLTPYGEFGYRWVFGSVLMGFGPRVGVRFPLAHTLNRRGDGASCLDDDSCTLSGTARFEGTLALELGILD